MKAVIVFAIWAGLSVLLFAGIAASEPVSDINAKTEELLAISNATMGDVIRIFGEPDEYRWGDKTFTRENLPSVYLAVYPDDLQVFITDGKVIELRFESPDIGYVFRDKIRVGSSLEEVIRVVGEPIRTVTGEPQGWQDGVLYKDIDGTKGRCYYGRQDQAVRFFFWENKVVALYVTRSGYDAGKPFGLIRPVESVKKFDDVRGKDLSKINLRRDKDLIETLTFNEKTIWPKPSRMPERCNPEEILKKAMNPGLGIRELHKQGITGKGVNVAIIDQPLYLDHPEFEGKIAAYYDTGCGSESSMHGPAVASLLVGTNCGTAPDARIYYAAAPSWTGDAAYYGKALDWIVEQNAALAVGKKIRVVSVSAAPSGRGSPFKKNNQMWDEACRRAKAEGILVLCAGERGFIGPCWYDSKSPEDVSECRPGFPAVKKFMTRPDTILVPASPRTTAEESEKGDFGYQYYGSGGLSWAIPYCAGVLAMGWQIRPDISSEKMRELLFRSAYTTTGRAKIINPAEFIELVKKAKAGERGKKD
jgi:hypothetical protein